MSVCVLQRDVTSLFRPDRRGVCVRAVGPVLCHLLDLSVRVEQLCASEAYVAPQVSPLNQTFRGSFCAVLARSAFVLHA